MRRMDRYEDEKTSSPKRSIKNQELYQDISSNTKYTNITDVTNLNAYELLNREENTRESYQQRKRYQDIENQPKSKKELETFNHLYPKTERKIYDINSVLEDARKNRKEQDELEEKRKLKYTSYNILAGVNLEELAKYREEKKKRNATPEEEGIRELMDTIASKTLAGELDKETTVDLLSDLMATSAMDKVAPQKTEEHDEIKEAIKELEKETNIQEKEQSSDDEEIEEQEKNIEDEDDVTDQSIEIDISETGENKIDNSFYTKSMDLSNEDFDMSDDFQEKGLPLPLKILSIISFLAVVAVTAFFVYQRFK